MKLKPYIGHWIASAIMIMFGSWTLEGQWTLDINPSADYGEGSYMGFLSGLWRGNDALDLRNVDLARSVYLIFDLLHPYLLIAVGLWFLIIGYRRRKSNKFFVSGSRAEPNQDGMSPSAMNSETIWPPSIKHH